MTTAAVAKRLCAALGEWRNAIGDAHVEASAEVLRTLGQTTFHTGTRMGAYLRPANVDQVQRCVAIACANVIPVHAISQGRNWGLGGRNPCVDGVVVMDLSRLDRIRDCDAELGTVTVEPGVTFRQVFEYLQAQAPDFWLSSIGGSDLSSVLGNALERGEGFGPLGDRASHVCDFEVIGADGSLIQTGFSRFPGSLTSGLSRFSTGPGLESLFVQSNMGVVTAMTLWLSRKPAWQCNLRFRIPRLDAAPKVIRVLRELHQQRVLSDVSYGFWNVYKLLAKLGRYPWTRMNGQTPLMLFPDALKQPLFFSATLYGASEALGKAALELIGQRVDGHVDEWAFEVVDEALRSRMPERIPGYPSIENLQTVYWRKRSDVRSNHPERDRCGLVWLCPALPYDGPVLVDTVRKLTEIGLKHGFEPHIALTAISARLLHMYVNIVYDRDIEAQDSMAMACHDEMLGWLTRAGIYPYRLGVQSMTVMQQQNPSTADFIRKIKSAVDPKGILAPGRYVL